MMLDFCDTRQNMPSCKNTVKNLGNSEAGNKTNDPKYHRRQVTQGCTGYEPDQCQGDRYTENKQNGDQALFSGCFNAYLIADMSIDAIISLNISHRTLRSTDRARGAGLTRFVRRNFNTCLCAFDFYNPACLLHTMSICSLCTESIGT